MGVLERRVECLKWQLGVVLNFGLQYEIKRSPILIYIQNKIVNASKTLINHLQCYYDTQHWAIEHK
jgi:hypothetical protein